MCSKVKDSHGGGVAILIRSDLSYQAINPHRIINACNAESVDIAIIKIGLRDHRHLYIASIYNLPRNRHRKPSPGFWQDFFEFFSNFDNVIVAGDFNAHANLWSAGLSSNNAIGREIELAIDMNNFVCLNDASPTWFASDANSCSILDLFFVSSSIVSSFDFCSLTHGHGRDHVPVTLLSGCISPGLLLIRPTIDTRRVKWDSFSRTIDSDINNLRLTQDSVDNVYNDFCDSIKASLISSRGFFKHQKRYSSHYRANPWWNSVLN